MISQERLRLIGEPVALRPYCQDDVARIYEAVRESLAQLSSWMPWSHADYSIEESRTWVESCPVRWEERVAHDFAITDSSNGRFLGGCGLRIISDVGGIANLGYWVRTSRTRQGVATAATRLLAQFGFKELALNRVEIVVATRNRASQRVAEKAGATREGVLRNRLVISDTVHDAVMFSLIPEDLASHECRARCLRQAR